MHTICFEADMKHQKYPYNSCWFPANFPFRGRRRNKMQSIYSKIIYVLHKFTKEHSQKFKKLLEHLRFTMISVEESGAHPKGKLKFSIHSQSTNEMQCNEMEWACLFHQHQISSTFSDETPMVASNLVFVSRAQRKWENMQTRTSLHLGYSVEPRHIGANMLIFKLVLFNKLI